MSVRKVHGFENKFMNSEKFMSPKTLQDSKKLRDLKKVQGFKNGHRIQKQFTNSKIVHRFGKTSLILKKRIMNKKFADLKKFISFEKRSSRILISSLFETKVYRFLKIHGFK